MRWPRRPQACAGLESRLRVERRTSWREGFIFEFGLMWRGVEIEPVYLVWLWIYSQGASFEPKGLPASRNKRRPCTVLECKSRMRRSNIRRSRMGRFISQSPGLEEPACASRHRDRSLAPLAQESRRAKAWCALLLRHHWPCQPVLVCIPCAWSR